MKQVKVKYIGNESRFWLTIGKIYNIKNTVNGNYGVTNDKGFECMYPKEFFEIVEENKMKQVKCIKKCDNPLANNGNGDCECIIVGKVYDVIREDENDYQINNEYNSDIWYKKEFFEPIAIEDDYTSDELSIIKNALEQLFVDMEEDIQRFNNNRKYEYSIKPTEYASKVQDLLCKFQ